MLIVIKGHHATFFYESDSSRAESFNDKNNIVSSRNSNRTQRGRIDDVILVRNTFMLVPTTLRTTNKIIAMLYNSRISDFLPTYLTPRGIAMMIAARKENPRNQRRNNRSSMPRKIGTNARNGSVVRKQRERARVLP